MRNWGVSALRWGAVLVALGVTFAADVCCADDSKEAGWAGALVGVGFWEPTGMEVGVTGGYTFPFGLFLGTELSTNALGYEIGLPSRAHNVGRMQRYLLQVGYDVALDERWRLRPEVSVGRQAVRTLHGGRLGDGSRYTDSSIALGIGLATIVRLGWFFTGLEGHLILGTRVDTGDDQKAPFAPDLRVIAGGVL